MRQRLTRLDGIAKGIKKFRWWICCGNSGERYGGGGGGSSCSGSYGHFMVAHLRKCHGKGRRNRTVHTCVGGGGFLACVDGGLQDQACGGVGSGVGSGRHWKSNAFKIYHGRNDDLCSLRGCNDVESGVVGILRPCLCLCKGNAGRNRRTLGVQDAPFRTESMRCYCRIVVAGELYGA